MLPCADRLSFHNWLTVYLWLCHTCLGVLGYTNMLHQNIDYHLGELKKNLLLLDASRIHKRSTDYDVIMYKSLTAFCSQLTLGGDHDLPSGTIQTPTEPSTTDGPILHSRSVPGPREVTDEDFAHAQPGWPRPDIFPVRVKAERWENTVYFLFYVSHSGPANVFRTFSFDYKSVALSYPDDYTTAVLSTVPLVVNASVCDVSDTSFYHETEPHYVFSQGDKGRYLISVTVDLCRFDKIWNDTTLPGGDPVGWVNKEDRIISQDIPLPLFKIMSDPGDQVRLQRRKNATLDINIMLSDEVRHVGINARLWDYNARKMLEPTVHLSLSYEGDKIGIGSNQETWKEKVLTVEVVKQETFNDTGDGDESGGRKFSVDVRVTVSTAYKRRSGRLEIHYRWHHAGDRPKTIAKAVNTVRVIWLKHPKIKNYFPRNTVVIADWVSKFECTEDGMRLSFRRGKNCSLYCQAFGTDMSSIFITRPGSKFNPFRSVSYVDGNHAYAMIDVGPASQHNDGDYRCIVVTSNGKKVKSELSLYTSMFTNVTHLSLEQLDNDTALVTCTAFGVQPLNISIEAGDNDGNWDRVDDKDDNEREEVTFGNYKNLTVLLSADQLRYPKQSLSCDADGARGYDEENLWWLENYITNHNPFLPKIDTSHNVTFMYNFGNGTVEVRCLARGGKPLEFWITYGGSDERYRIDLDPENVRTVTETAEGSIFELLVPTKTIDGRTSWVDCRAGNTHGEDWYAMNTYGII